MRISTFLGTLYLGDRACKSIALDCWNGLARIQVDCISRIRHPSGEWRFYTDEDIQDGYIVFTGVAAFELHNDGRLPNDFVQVLRVVDESEMGTVVELSIGSVSDGAPNAETLLKILCKGMHLEDPNRPNVRIET